MPRLMPTGKQQYFDLNGNPLIGGKVYTFEPGPGAQKPTYSNAAGTVENENPVILDARGEALIFWDGVYDIQVKDANDNLIYSVTNYSAQSDASSVAYGGVSLDAILKNSVNKVVSSISELRGVDKTKYAKALVAGYYTSGDGGGGFYYYDSSDTTSADNGGTIIVATDGGRWKLSYQGSLSIKQFGAKSDGTNVKNAVQALLLYLKPFGGGRVWVPLGSYYTASGFDLYASENKTYIFEGEGRIVTEFWTDQNIVVFTHGSNCQFRDFTVRQSGTPRQSRGFSSPTNLQVIECQYERLRVQGFKYGAWWRYSLWNSVRDCRFISNLCGIKMSRNALPDDQTNPAAPGAWNVDGGFFHNANTFDNVLVDGGEVGIWGTCNGNLFNNLTVQGQNSDGSSNGCLPVGTKGIGLYLQHSGTGTSSFGAIGNQIGGVFYSEVTQQPLVMERVTASLESSYVQGNTLGSPYPQAFRIVGGELEVRGGSHDGADYWTRIVWASDGAVITKRLNGGAYVTQEYLVDTDAQYFRDRDTAVTPFISNNMNNGSTSTIFTGMSANSTYTVSASGIYNGASGLIAEFYVFYFGSGISRVIKASGSDAEIGLSVSGSDLVLSITGAVGDYDMKGIVTNKSALASV